MDAVISRILVPVDFSPCAEAALEYATFVAGSFGASVDVLHVWEPPARMEPWHPAEVDRVIATSRKDLQTRLDRWVEPHRRGTMRVVTRVSVDRPVQGILREASRSYDLIVIGTHGRTGLARVLLGSVAEAVLRRAPCPVVTIRAAHAATARAA